MGGFERGREALDALGQTSTASGSVDGRSPRGIHRSLAVTVALAFLSLAIGCGAGAPTGSIGAVLGRDRDTHSLVVRDVPEGLAADEAGLLSGDEIIMIDGSYARDLDEAGVRTRLRGIVGTTVEVTVVRGGNVLHLTIKRGPMRERKPAPPKEQRISE
jgi:S1-C subfamily serine protease